MILWVTEVFFLSLAAGIGVGRKPTHLTAQERSLAPRLGKWTSCYNTEERMASVNATTRMKLKHAAAHRYAHSGGVIIMQSKIGQGWCFLMLWKCLLVSFRFGVNIIHWLLYNVIWWSHGRPQHEKGTIFSDWRGRIPVPHDHLRVTILIPWI